MPNKAIISLKVAAFIAALVPFALLVYGGFTNDLGPDPIATLTHVTGDWTIRFLLITLAISPVRKLSVKLNWLIRFRRMMGLFAFFYGTAHLTTYIWLFSNFDVHTMLTDIAKRKFITAGMLAWFLMLPLALTSTAWAIRKMGGKNWQRLHWLIYFSAFAGLAHYWWLVKPGVTTPMTVTVIFFVLIAARIVYKFVKPGKKAMPVRAPVRAQ